MADTIAELSDLLTQQQREINDLEVKVSRNDADISHNSDDINDLKHPPAGVPPGLLDWWSSHGTREVDTQLDTDLTTLAAGVAANDTGLSDISDRIDAEELSRIEIDTNLNDTDIAIQAQVTDNLNALNQEIADRSALSVTVSDGMDAVNTRVDDLQSDLDAASTTASTASVSMSSQIASLSSSLQTANTQILLLQGTGVDPLGALASQITTLTTIAHDAADDVATEINDRKNADIAIQASINTLNTSISGISDSISDEKDAREAADLDIQSDVSALTAEIAGHGGLISAETASRIAADATLTTAVDANTEDLEVVAFNLSDDFTLRETADDALQALIDTNTTDITANTASITSNTDDLTLVKSKYGVVKDGGGYITQWWINDESGSAGKFKVRNLNNDARLENPGYVGKYFPVVPMASFSSGDIYDTDWGGATPNDFHGTDGNDYSRLVKVYRTLTTGLNGSVFLGTDNSTGGSLSRLGQSVTTFKVDFSGAVNRYLSVWYRIKNVATDNIQRWFPVALVDNVLPSARDYEPIRGQQVVQITVPVGQVVEFGLTTLNTFDTTIGDSTKAIIYNGTVSVIAVNMTTIS